MAKNPPTGLTISADDLSGEPTQALLAFHLRQMHLDSPPGSVFALDLSSLRDPDVTVWTAKRGADVVAMGAMKKLHDGTAELKSMRTHPNHLREGAAAAILDHVIAVARRHRFKTLWLETGSGPAFEAALTLYRKRGFVESEPFADYTRTRFNQFFYLNL